MAWRTLGRSLPDAADGSSWAMDAPPTKDQITVALTRAANAIRPHTTHGDRLLQHPLKGHSAERRGNWWLIGHIRVLGAPEEWDVLYDPATNEGKLRVKH